MVTSQRVKTAVGLCLWRKGQVSVEQIAMAATTSREASEKSSRDLRDVRWWLGGKNSRKFGRLRAVWPAMGMQGGIREERRNDGE